jgi:hypothetical protein
MTNPIGIGKEWENMFAGYEIMEPGRRRCDADEVVATENLIRAGPDASMGYSAIEMVDVLWLIGGFVRLFRSYAAREAEIIFVNKQLLAPNRSAPVLEIG